MRLDKRPKLRKIKGKVWVVYLKHDETFDDTGLYDELCAMEKPYRHWIDVDEGVWKFVTTGWTRLVRLVAMLQRHSEIVTVCDQDGTEVRYDFLQDDVNRLNGTKP